MSVSRPDRREFIVGSARALGGAWVALSLPALASLAACARDAAQRGEPLSLLTPEEGRQLAALADTILPPDDETPGAVDAGAVHFVDRALAGPFQGMSAPIRDGLADLSRRGFADLSAARREAAVREMEQTPFFGAARMLIVAGVFSDPAYGGNRDGAGHRILQMEHAGAFQPPFGFYDRAEGTGSGSEP